MIKVVNGDVTTAKENIIGHQVNARGVMGSGVAVAMKNLDASVFKEYRTLYEQTGNKEDLLGKVQLVNIGKDKYVANLFGQLDYGVRGRGKVYTNYDALDKCFKNLREQAEHLDLTVALPYKIASDRGGADWNKVYKLIEKHFGDYGITLYKYR